MKRPQESTWSEGVCKNVIGPRSYMVVSVVVPTEEVAVSCEWCGNQILCLLWNKQLNCRGQISTLLQNQQLSPCNQCHKQTSQLLWNLLPNMWKLRPRLLLQGVAVLSNYQPVFRTLRLRLYTLLETLFWTLLLLRNSVPICKQLRHFLYKGEDVVILHKLALKLLSCVYARCPYVDRNSSLPFFSRHLAHVALHKNDVIGRQKLSIFSTNLLLAVWCV